MKSLKGKILLILLLTAHSWAQNPEGEVQPPPPEISDPGGSVAPPSTQEAPDTAGATDEEARFSRIYQKYNKREIGDDKWKEIAGDKVAESYNLQDGDNLWDISTKLFGNGYYWPKVWQLNDDITNPHLVERGRTLQFTPGSSTSAPSLGVDVNLTENTTSTTEISQEPLVNEPEFDTVVTLEAPEGNQVVIPPGKISRPVLKNIPPSFKETYKTVGNYDRKTGFAKDGLKRKVAKITPSPIQAIVVEKAWQRDGKILEMEGDSTVATTFQNIIVALSGPAQIGDGFTVFSTNGKVIDPTTDYSIGVELETRAEIEITEAIESGDENTYRAIIKDAILPVRLGDSIKAGWLITKSKFEAVGPRSNVAARIVNGENNKRFVMALHSAVYLDKGDDDGLHIGDILPVLKNISTRNPDTRIAFDTKPIGLIKVVEVEPHVSTAVIVGETDAIRPGDMTQVVEVEKKENPADVESSDALEPEDKAIEKDGG
jgi:hypothetical protein